MSDAKKLKEFVECEMIYDPEKKLQEEMIQKANESSVSIRLNSDPVIDLEGLQVKDTKFEDGQFTMDLQVPPGVWRYTQAWVNRRCRKAQKAGRVQLYYYYYRNSWERFVENYWPKTKPEGPGEQVCTITYPGV